MNEGSKDQKWFMLTLVGEDRPGIVAHLSAALFDGGCNLGEATMMRRSWSCCTDAERTRATWARWAG